MSKSICAADRWSPEFIKAVAEVTETSVECGRVVAEGASIEELAHAATRNGEAVKELFRLVFGRGPDEDEYFTMINEND